MRPSTRPVRDRPATCARALTRSRARTTHPRCVLPRPGFFLSAAGGSSEGQSSAAERPPQGYDDIGDEAGTRLTPITLQRKPADKPESAAFKRFAMHTSFEEAIGVAVYPPAAWFLRPPPPASGRPTATSAVVWPLSEVIDETYSVYFDLLR